MASNLLSRWRSSNNPSASIYDTLRQHDDDSDISDTESAAYVNDLQTGEDFHDIENGAVEQADARSAEARPQRRFGPRTTRRGAGQADRRSSRPKWLTKGQRLFEVEDADDDVPASLLIEGADVGLSPGSIALPPPPSVINERRPSPRRGQQPRSAQGGSQTTSTRPGTLPAPPPAIRRFAGIANADPREKALYRWTNVVNLDVFLDDVYMYYQRNGFWSILLGRLIGLLTVAFVIGFSLFLTQCIDYRLIKSSSKLEEVLISRCTRRMGFLPNILLWATTFIWVSKVFQCIRDTQRLRHLHDFYLYLLQVSDIEIQSIEWQEIVSRLMALRDSNPTIAPNTAATTRKWAHTQSKQRMDAHDIANRLMRRDNYMIAMINKDILDMTLPIPFLRNRQLFTRTLEWNLNYCIMDFVFNSKGQVRPLFLQETHRKELSEALRRRFLFAGTANLVIAPFFIIFILIQSFFSYFNEYQKNPSAIGSRQYNVFAEWKFREFNELWHLFQKRMNMSYPFAARYVDQFPKDKTVQAARLVTFISGAVISVLGLATVFDQENFLSFEITHGRTTIFYLGLFGGVWAIARGMIPEDSMVNDPAFSMNEVIEFTHYQPAHWSGRLHTAEVKTEFEQLYQMKIAVFMEEILSMVFTPFVLWFSLPKCSDRIIDFFREFTVHVDGIGYVCSFAEFKLRKPVEHTTGADQRSQLGVPDAPRDLRDDYFASKDQKLEQSYWGFMNDYSRNPKAIVGFAYRNTRRRLNMPPPVPGLLSPTLQGGPGSRNVTTGGRHGSVFSPQKTSRTSTFQAQSTASPMQSLLLDPHHQPSMSGFGGAPLGQSRTNAVLAKSSRRAVDYPADVAEEEEDEPPDGMQQPILNPSELGSWKYDDDSEVSVEEDNQADRQGDIGVLGLIRQLQKAQGEGTRAAIGI